MATHTSKYGTLITGRYADRRRYDTWISASDGQHYPEPTFATGKDDQSNNHNSMSAYYGGDYQGERCACCYLGFTHTEEYHKAACKAHDEAIANWQAKQEIEE